MLRRGDKEKEKKRKKTKLNCIFEQTVAQREISFLSSFHFGSLDVDVVDGERRNPE